MEEIIKLLGGFSAAISPVNIFYCLIGTFVGNLIGVLPGIGPPTAMALLLPLTYGRDPVTSVIMLAGIYYGAMYGGSVTSVLLNVPGESSSVPTALEGHPMAKQGRAGAALGMAAIVSFFAGTVSIIALMYLTGPVSTLAMMFGAPEFFSLMVLGLCMVTALSSKSVIKGWITAVIGLILGTVGMDEMTGIHRFTFGQMELFEGIDFLIVVMGVFAIDEVLDNIGTPTLQAFKTKVGGMLPTREDWGYSFWAMIRGTIIGFLAGVVPGGGATVGSFLAYGVEQKISKRPELFGKGAIEGIASCEAANNSSASGALIPLFTLGIPSTASSAIILAALLMAGLQPGPFLFQNNPLFVWTIIASMYIGNVMLLAMNMPLIGVFIRLLNVPYKALMVGILTFSFIGAYSVGNKIFDLWMMLGIALVGYIGRRLDFSPVPLILGVVLGRNIEIAFRRSLLTSFGDVSIFFTRPVSAGLLILAAIWLLFVAFGIKNRPVNDED